MKNPDPQPTHTLWLGYAAAAWAVIFAAISFYWAAGIGMLLYGAASFVQHLLMATGVITLPPGLGRTGAYGHLLLWDPWWSLGGILFIAVSYQLSAVSRRLKADG